MAGRGWLGARAMVRRAGFPAWGMGLVMTVTGISKLKVVPWPGSVANCNLPPMSCTKFWLMGRPNPVPSGGRSLTVAWEKGAKNQVSILRGNAAAGVFHFKT